MWNIAPAKLPVTIFMLSLSAWPIATLCNDLSDFERKIEPVEVSGHVLSSMIGVPTENIRVYASRNNKLLPIPFQIDQKNAAGDWVMRFPVKGVEMLAVSRYRNNVFSRARIPKMTESISIGSDQSNVNRLAGLKDATSLGLYGDRLAVVTRIKIPESIGDDFSIEPYLANDSGQALEAGYFIQTRPDIRKGEHVLHSVFLILADSDEL